LTERHARRSVGLQGALVAIVLVLAGLVVSEPQAAIAIVAMASAGSRIRRRGTFTGVSLSSGGRFLPPPMLREGGVALGSFRETSTKLGDRAIHRCTCGPYGVRR